LSVKLYDVSEISYSCKNYDIKVNGVDVTPDTARVSAMPFNRRWPGHQRSEDQTELVNFVSMAMDEPVTFEITPKIPFKAVKIRPKRLGITPEIKDGVIRFTLDKPAYFTVEPYGRHNALHVFADPMLDYGVDIHADNVLYFGKGYHEVGTIKMQSNQTLFLDEGAVVYACIEAMDVDNIRILGRGILDNSHNKEVIFYEANAVGNDSAVNNATRQHTIQLEYCNNVLIDGITIRDSLVYNVRPIGCEKLTIKNVKIIGNWRYNSDGIDMHNCIDVLIENCFIRTFDDSICIKGFDCYYEGDVEAAVKAAMYRNGKAYDVFKNVLVTGCTIWNDWGKCLEIGAETRAEEIYNIVFENCDIIHSSGLALDCCNIDYADVHDLIYRDIYVDHDDEIQGGHIQLSDADRYEYHQPQVNSRPLLMAAMVGYHHEYSAGGTRRGINRDIVFENIHVYGDAPLIATFDGYTKEHQTKDVTIRNIFKNGKKVDPSEIIIRKNEFVENIVVE